MKLNNHLLQNYEVASPYQETHVFKQSILNGDPVVVKDEGKFLGIITLKDIAVRQQQLIIDSFSDKPNFQTHDDSLSVLLFMCHNNYDFLAAMEGNEFRGVISRNKLVLDYLNANYELTALHDRVLELKKEIFLKNKFLAIIGHDIKNLFTQVLSSLELLDQKLQPFKEIKMQAALRLARKSAEQVNSAFEGMLLWARLGTGQLPFQPQELLLNDYINKVVNQFQLAGNVKSIRIRSCLNTPLSVFADPNMLGCIMLNLVYNAIKFTPSGGEIWLNAVSDNTATEIVVVDSGLGMSLQQKNELFSGGKSTAGTANEVGAGIGLAICKDFVEKHRGSLEFASESGNGTRVIVTFPHAGRDLNQKKDLLMTDF